MKCIPITLLMSLAVVSPLTMAADDKPIINLKPVMIESKELNTTTLGLKYEIKDTYHFGGKPTATTTEGQTVTFGDIKEATHGGNGYVGFDANGTWTVDKADNPTSTSTAALKAGYHNFQGNFSLDTGLDYKLEGDQDYSEKNSMYGLFLDSYYSFTRDRSTYVIMGLGYDKIDAAEDSGRTALTTTDTYDRFSVDLLLKYSLEKLNKKKYGITSLELKYSYYEEVDAPAAIVNANLDTFNSRTFVINFNRGLYVAYSSGNLPFDKQNDRVFQIGFDQNLFD
ncbi:MAG: hypothetical protein OEZ39_16690 [Gammaproteobacteria bacterium]|nr:hypothetical protein [Gammaproteobacteria bacterium]MDH5653498.1 hypothetical protein [Gammaproteobacteria bacterium]